MRLTEAGEFLEALAQLCFRTLILEPYQGLASKAMQEKAQREIRLAISSQVRPQSYRRQRDIYLYIHLIQARRGLALELERIQREAADENPVQTLQVSALLEEFYARLKTEYENHHGQEIRPKAFA